MFNNKKTYIIAVLALILLGFCARLLPHAANIAPIGAIALFGALYLPKRWAIAAPVLAMFFSDIFIGFYSLPIMATVYGSFIATGVIGLWVRDHKSFTTVLGGTMLGAVIFFLTTNGAVWVFGTMYSHTLPGLLESYTMALPFFRNSVIGDLGYTTLLVGEMEIMLAWRSKLSTGIYAGSKGL